MLNGDDDDVYCIANFVSAAVAKPHLSPPIAFLSNTVHNALTYRQKWQYKNYFKVPWRFPAIIPRSSNYR